MIAVSGAGTRNTYRQPSSDNSPPITSPSEQPAAPVAAYAPTPLLPDAPSRNVPVSTTATPLLQERGSGAAAGLSISLGGGWRCARVHFGFLPGRRGWRWEPPSVLFLRSMTTSPADDFFKRRKKITTCYDL